MTMHRLVVWPGMFSRTVVTLVLALLALEYHDPSAGQEQVWGTDPGWNLWVAATGAAAVVSAVSAGAYVTRSGRMVGLQRAATVLVAMVLVLRGIAIWQAFPDSLAAAATYVGFGVTVGVSWAWSLTEQSLVDTAEGR